MALVEISGIALEDSPTLENLPEDLLRMILVRLPTLSLVQVRSMCKTWNRIVTCEPPYGTQKAWFLFCRRVMRDDGMQTICRAFDPVSSRWFGIPLPTTSRRGVQLRIVAGGYSAMVLLQETYQEQSYFVLPHYWIGNPLLGRWQRVTYQYATVLDFRDMHALILDDDTKGFKILRFVVRVNFRLSVCTTAIYDSSSNRWKPGATLRISDDEFLLPNATAVLKGAVYFLLHFFRNILHLRIVAYIVDQDRFEVILPAVPAPVNSEGDCDVEKLKLLVDDSRDGHIALAYFVGARRAAVHLKTYSQTWQVVKQSKLKLGRGTPFFSTEGDLKLFYIVVASDASKRTSIWMHNADSIKKMKLPDSIQRMKLPEDSGLMGEVCVELRQDEFSSCSILPQLDVSC